jgi:HlyD family secretion protein
MPVETNKVDLSSLKINRTVTTSETTGGGSRRLLVIGSSVVVLALITWLVVSSGFLHSVQKVETSTITMVSPGQAGAVLTASGYVVASRKAAVGSKGTGRLIFLGVEEGSHVVKDQIIARLEAIDVNAALQQSLASLAAQKANFENVHAAMENADSTMQRTRILFKQGLSSHAELTSAESQYRQFQAQQASAAANVQLAERGIQAAQVQVEFTNIRAPFEGTVLTKDADVGTIITPFGAASGSKADVVTVADMSSLDAEVDVSEANISQVHVGQPCEITLDAVPDKRYSGHVHMIVPTADRSKATVLTKVDFANRDSRVLPEMSLKVNFLKDSSAAIDTSGPKLTVPASAIVTKGGTKTVFVVRGDVVTEVAVVLGPAIGNGFEIRQGLSAGDKVVLHPSEKMSSGTKVQIQE